MARHLLIFFFFFLSTFSHAQQIKDIHVQSLGVGEGLSHYSVNSFYQDEQGFIWIGTRDGLNKFNGRTVEAYKPVPDDTTSLSENNIRAITGDRNGVLYIKGNESLSEFDMHTLRFRVIRDKGVSAMFYGNGDLWMAVGGHFLRYDRQEREIIPVFILKDGERTSFHITCFGISANGDFYICTDDAGYYRVDGSGKILQHIPAGEVNSVYEDRQGNIWIGTRAEGIVRIDREGNVKRYAQGDEPGGLSHNNVRQVQQADEHTYLVATFEGLSLLDTRTNGFTHYRYEDNLEAKNIRSIVSMFRDRQGVVWLGTFYEGVHYYNTEDDVFRYYYPAMDVPGRLSSPIVSSVAEDRNGFLWVGTEGGGLNRLDRTTGRFQTYRKGAGRDNISSDVVKSLYYDREPDILWVSTLYDGLNRFDLARNEIRRIPNTIWNEEKKAGRAQNIVRTTAWSADTLLLATAYGAVFLDKKTERLSPVRVDYVTSRPPQIWDVLAENPESIWLTTSLALYRYNPVTGITRTYHFGEILGSEINNMLNRIFIDSQGRLWFGSSGSGLFLYRPQTDTFTRFGTSMGLNNGYITGISEIPSSGKLLIATNGGLSVLDVESEHFENFNSYNGFPFTTINEGSLFLATDEEIYACDLRGMLVSVQSDALELRQHDYQVYVTDLKVNNRRVKPADGTDILEQAIPYQQQVRLQPSHTVVTFEFASNDFLSSSRTGIEYRLEGFDPDFHRADITNTATYTNLNPGEYTFIVRGTTLDSQGEYPSFPVRVTVLPPFYKTLWFFGLCLLVIGATGYHLLRAYLRGIRLQASLENEQREKQHIEAMNQAKLQVFTNISHEFRTPLTLINGHLEMLLQKRDIRPTVYNRILSVYKNSQRMRRLADEVIDLRQQEQGFMKLKVRRDDLAESLREIALSFDEYARHNRIEFTFRSDPQSIPAWFDPEQMEKVIYNLLSNAFKYTRPGNRIDFSVSREENEILIRITDNGIGITPEHIDRIFERFYQDHHRNADVSAKGSGIGLAISKTIVEMHQGEISVSSEPGVETAFTIRLPGELDLSREGIVVLEAGDRSRYVNDFDRTEWAVPEEAAPENKAVRMLVVEDNDEVRELLVQVFGPIYDVHTAPDGTEGFEMAKTLQPDIILSDIMMPGLSGTELCTKLKSHNETSHIPVVLLTARNAEEHIVEGLLTGADDYITKPFNLKILVARCNNLIAGRKRLQQKYQKEPDTSLNILSSNPADQKLLDLAESIVQNHINSEEFNIEVFAREMGLSRTYLFSKIKGLTGQTPNDFILTIRLKKATAALLDQPEAGIASIAYDFGFSSPSYFIKCFKTLYGETPHTYRKRMSEKGK